MALAEFPPECWIRYSSLPIPQVSGVARVTTGLGPPVGVRHFSNDEWTNGMTVRKMSNGSLHVCQMAEAMVTFLQASLGHGEVIRWSEESNDDSEIRSL
jgi:hypothetical protein